MCLWGEAAMKNQVVAADLFQQQWHFGDNRLLSFQKMLVNHTPLFGGPHATCKLYVVQACYDAFKITAKTQKATILGLWLLLYYSSEPLMNEGDGGESIHHNRPSILKITNPGNDIFSVQASQIENTSRRKYVIKVISLLTSSYPFLQQFEVCQN